MTVGKQITKTNYKITMQEIPVCIIPDAMISTLERMTLVCDLNA